ncbi:hypothetical protein psyc5s11_30420 [Clostridium gelidum]|uniref:SMODS and SLOG-associating 2TM effector domain-containing protein n=1 Tax=Clostridium gelidum TaxID=704125 RepID=A0ABM7T4R5_9CLOT|nr:hypothetical protein [Clostridium gelidum]BCZ46975.1 hypothetical protein psyc5s11_30420 [Clostridium gelidum]
MNYTNLDSIVDYFKSTSSYYKIKKPNSITLKTLIIYTLIGSSMLVIVIKLLNIKSLDLTSLICTSLVVSFILNAFFFNRKINKKTNEYIATYNAIHSLDFNKYDQVRLDIFYNYLLNNNIGSLSDENFNLLITYVKNQEDILHGDPSYNSKKTLITNSILAFIVSASSALTTKFITNNNQLIPFILMSSFIIGSIYTFLTSIIDFPNKISDEKDSYKALKTFLYKAKFRYNLEYQNENSENNNSNLNQSTKNLQNSSVEKENFSIIFKTKLHKIVDILF